MFIESYLPGTLNLLATAELNTRSDLFKQLNPFHKVTQLTRSRAVILTQTDDALSQHTRP